MKLVHVAYSPTCTPMTGPPLDIWFGAVILMMASMYGFQVASYPVALVRNASEIELVTHSEIPPAVVSALI